MPAQMRKLQSLEALPCGQHKLPRGQRGHPWREQTFQLCVRKNLESLVGSAIFILCNGPLLLSPVVVSTDHQKLQTFITYRPIAVGRSTPALCKILCCDAVDTRHSNYFLIVRKTCTATATHPHLLGCLSECQKEKQTSTPIWCMFVWHVPMARKLHLASVQVAQETHQAPARVSGKTDWCNAMPWGPRW